MIEQILKACDFEMKASPPSSQVGSIPMGELGVALSAIENKQKPPAIAGFKRKGAAPLVLGVTGTGGAGKSSLVDELMLRFLHFFPEAKIGVVSVDPSKRKTGGALLGDRIRMNSLSRPGTFMRSVASRGSGNEISEALPAMLQYLKDYDFDLLVAERSFHAVCSALGGIVESKVH
jgi:methylmalonyl-CoA mutase